MKIKEQPRQNRIAVLVVILFFVLITIVFLIATGALSIYNGRMNSGIVLGTETWDVGFEWRGHVGFFHESGGDQPPPPAVQPVWL